MAKTDPVAEQRERMRATLASALEAEFAERAAGRSNRPATPSPVAGDCKALMEADKEPVRMAALTICTAKAAFPLVDVQALQGGEVDFRSRAKDTIVPLLREVTDREKIVARFSNDPLVSNPYREKRLDDDWLIGRRGDAKRLGPHLVTIARFLQASPSFAHQVLAELVAEHVDRWDTQKVAYPLPSRVSHALVMEALNEFLATVAGGTHLEWVSVALLRFVGEKWGPWDRVVGHESNDAAPFDAECYLGGALVALAESKDLIVTEGHVRQLADEMRARNAQRGFLFTRDIHVVPNRLATEALAQKRHAAGERILLLDLPAVAGAWLALGDESDANLPRFLRLVCDVLDEWSGLSSRREWADILSTL